MWRRSSSAPRNRRFPKPRRHISTLDTYERVVAELLLGQRDVYKRQLQLLVAKRQILHAVARRLQFAGLPFQFGCLLFQRGRMFRLALQ